MKRLTETAFPTIRNGIDTRWFNFYVPLKFQREQSLIAMGIVEYKSEYFLHFESSEWLRSIVIKKGDKHASTVLTRVIELASEFAPRMQNRKSIETMVPYFFRTGKIKGKYVLDRSSLVSKEYADRIFAKYESHLAKTKPLEHRISLNDYLKVVRVGKSSVLKETTMMSSRDVYVKHADFRHGGMLDIEDPDSVEEFNEWLKSNEWLGSHPFEIVASYSNYGIYLYPPGFHTTYTSYNSHYELSVGNETFHDDYLKMLEALMRRGIPVLAPQLREVLKYEQGESYLKVNTQDIDSVFYEEIDRQCLKYVRWDTLKIVWSKNFRAAS
jgi:hypothetical protein